MVIPFSLRLLYNQVLPLRFCSCYSIELQVCVLCANMCFIVKEMIISSFNFTVGNNSYELLFRNMLLYVGALYWGKFKLKWCNSDS